MIYNSNQSLEGIILNEFAQLEKKIKLKIVSRIIKFINFIVKNKVKFSRSYLKSPFSNVPRVKIFYKYLLNCCNKKIFPINNPYYNSNEKVDNELWMYPILIKEFIKILRSVS